METNETILGREVVSIADRKRLGKVDGLRVDVDTCAVSGFIVTNPSTGSSLILPFEQALSTGNTFITVEQHSDLLSLEAEQAQPFLANGFALLGVDVFSRLGDALGRVANYSFDTTYGTIVEFVLEGGATYSHESFVFFAYDMLFVDDGGVTADEMRRGKSPKTTKAKAPARKGKAAPRKAVPGKKAVAPRAAAKLVSAPAPASAPTAAVDKDDEVKNFLLNLRLNQDVTSDDGSFEAKAGTVLTQSIIDAAAKSDALLLLALSVDD